MRTIDSSEVDTEDVIKVCSHCDEPKEVVEGFSKDRTSPDGYSYTCKTCVSQRNRLKLLLESPENRASRLSKDSDRHRNKRMTRPARIAYCACCGDRFLSKLANTKYCSDTCRKLGSPDIQRKVKELSARKYARVAVWLEQYKTERGCIDCGYNSYSEALQLDHEGAKSAEISKLRYSIAKLKQEIETGRCVVRCANCHAVKTRAQKRGTWVAPLQQPPMTTTLDS